jgi:hypothetical protein
MTDIGEFLGLSRSSLAVAMSCDIISMRETSWEIISIYFDEGDELGRMILILLLIDIGCNIRRETYNIK